MNSRRQRRALAALSLLRPLENDGYAVKNGTRRS